MNTYFVKNLNFRTYLCTKEKLDGPEVPNAKYLNDTQTLPCPLCKNTSFFKTDHSNSYITLSVLRIFVHSVSCHFSCENSCNSNFSVKLQHSLLDFCYLTIFSDLVLIINFNSNFLLEAGQILERSQWIQIL